MKFSLLTVVTLILLSACQPALGPDYTSGDTVEAPDSVRADALSIAREYKGVPYTWGGQSADGMDCSGLIVRAYKRAVKGTDYQLLFDDAAVAGLLADYTRRVDEPEPGDILFMGEDEITHAALYIEQRDGHTYFIDAFSTAGEVAVRSYSTGHYKFKSAGRLLVLAR